MSNESNSVWDNPEMKVQDNYVKFENVGDSVEGTVVGVEAHRWDDGSVSPKLIISDFNGEERVVTAGQIRLKAALAEQRPESGDYISIRFTSLEKRQGGKTLKHFDVEVRKGAPQRTASAPIGGGYQQATTPPDWNAAPPAAMGQGWAAPVAVDPAVMAKLQSDLGATPVATDHRPF